MSFLAENGGDCLLRMWYEVSACTTRDVECLSWFGIGKGVQDSVWYKHGSWWLLITRQWIVRILTDHDALFLMCVLDTGFGAVSRRFILCIGGQLVVTWEFQKQFIMGDKLACLSNIQPNGK